MREKEDGAEERGEDETTEQEGYAGEKEEEPEIVPAPPEPREDDLRASSNSLDLSSQEPGAAETGQDDQQLIYATVSETHKAKKRAKMMKEAQKRELKARKDKRKMEQKTERERRKKAAKERKQREKERKKMAKERQERMDMGLGNVVHLHEVDTSTKQGKAQAKFIDAATAAIF